MILQNSAQRPGSRLDLLGTAFFLCCVTELHASVV